MTATTVRRRTDQDPASQGAFPPNRRRTTSHVLRPPPRHAQRAAEVARAPAVRSYAGARKLGIHDTMLGNWVSQYRKSMAGLGSKPRDREAPTERERQLERESRKLREENAFLAKAACFFARDHR
ncbi:transposase [Embleya sp. NPDC127516]|uniref:transposase n=1 Tax=Embleya sp. NPDC127516 TaxID=3363990 RepID=UPI00380CD687